MSKLGKFSVAVAAALFGFGATAAPCTITVSVANPDDGTATVSSATVEEGASVTITATPTADGKAFNYWSGTGCLPQRLTHDASATFKVTEDCELVAHFAPSYYVKTDGDDAKDGLTPATAKASVAAAVNAAQEAGDEAVVLVAAGTYKVAAAAGLVNLTKAVTVRGMGATRDDTIIRSGYKNLTYLVTLGHENCAIQHLRLEGGSTEAAYGGISLSAGLVTDCSVTAFKGTAGESASVPVLMTGGLLADSRIFGNSPKTSYGAHGGLQMSAGIAENCEIVDNVAGGSTGGSESDRRSGGVYMTGGTLRNCLVAGNMHPIAASGIAIRNGNPIVENCTIAGNFYDLATTTRIVRGVERNGGTATFSKCIIAGNTSFGQPYANVNAVDGKVTGITFTDTCFGGETVEGEGNITAMPLFADPENGDYSVGHGTWDGWGYKPSEKAFRVGFTVTSDGAVDSAAVTLAAQVKGDTEGVVYTWTIRNADTGAVVQTVSGADKATVETTLSGGLYTVTLSATNASAETDSFTSAKCLTVYQSETVVTATGQVSLQAAIDRTAAGGTVRVGDGTYAQDVRLDILRGVRVVSENGPSATKLFIRTNQRAIDTMHVKPMIVMNDADALLSGFELRCANSKGTKTTCYGMVYTYVGGTVSNCVFNAGDFARSGYMCARAVSAGRFLDCVIRNARLNPSGSNSYQCGLGITLETADGLADRCVVSNCWYTGGDSSKQAALAGGGIRSIGGTVRNTLVVGNQHAFGGGGIYANGGLVENCTVVGNKVINSRVSGQKDYGLYANNGAVIRNCIVRGNSNTADTVDRDLFADESTTVENCDFPTATSSVAGATDKNIDEDPLFDGATYVITRDSPCKDKGVEQPWMAGAIDLKGDVRVAYGIPDIGCYEYFVPATVEETLAVTSPYGEVGVASPAYGENKGIWGGRSFTATVSLAVTNETAGVAYECTGWKLYDADDVEKDSGTGNSFAYTHPNPAEFRRLEWQFDRVFLVRQTYGGLTSAPADTSVWVREGESVSLSAIGSETGKTFNFWSGADLLPVQALHETFVTFSPTSAVNAVAQYSPVYYVATDGNDEENDGLTPETAKATIAGAMALGDESIIMIGPGTYGISKAADLIVLESGITLCGNAASREDVILKCTSKESVLVTISDARAAVRHLTLSGNGSSTRCKAANLTAGLIADCHITKFHGLDISSVENATVYLRGNSALVGSTVNDNHAFSQTGCAGGGVGMSAGTLVADCQIYGNSCIGVASGGGNRHGGGVFMSGGTLRNSLVAGNMHRIGGSGLSVYTGSDCLIENCTIVDNLLNIHPGYYYGFSPEVVYGVQRHGSGTGVFRSCIIVGNTAWKAGEYNVNASEEGVVAGLAFENCAFGHETVVGAGNVAERPVFADPENLDYSVGAGLCADKGYRPLAADKLQAGFTLAADGAADESVVTLTAVTGGNAAGAVYSWSVAPADGGEPVYTASGADKAVVTPTLTSGVYTVSLTVATATEEATFTGRKALTVQSTDTYVTTDDGSLSLHEAFRRTADGGTVHVADGTYYYTENLAIDRPVTIVSENGPGKTKIYVNPIVAFFDDSHAKPCFYLKHADATLSGFELRCANQKGAPLTTGYGIAYLFYGGGTVSNCVFHGFGNNNNNDHAVYASGAGRIVDCVIRNGSSNGASSSDSYCGLGLYLTGADCLADRCVITNNRYNVAGKDVNTAGGGVVLKNGATLRNSYVADNRHARGGGGVWVDASTLENCTVLGNSVIGNENKGYGVYASGAAVLRNNIIRDNMNEADNAAQDVFAAAEATVEYNDYPEDSSSVATKGEGNIDKDPVFRPGTYRLKLASPCVNAGKPGAAEPGALDLFGKPRTVCGRIDMGCHEFQNFGTMIMVR